VSYILFLDQSHDAQVTQILFRTQAIFYYLINFTIKSNEI